MRGYIFVFGSNLQGIHGAGAAKDAVDLYGAIMGQGEGLQGSSYAIPTKATPNSTMPLMAIRDHVEKFLDFAFDKKGKIFFLTKIGCGLAGYTDRMIAPMFKDASSNCILPSDWIRIIENKF